MTESLDFCLLCNDTCVQAQHLGGKVSKSEASQDYRVKPSLRQMSEWMSEFVKDWVMVPMCSGLTCTLLLPPGWQLSLPKSIST